MCACGGEHPPTCTHALTPPPPPPPPCLGLSETGELPHSLFTQKALRKLEKEASASAGVKRKRKPRKPSGGWVGGVCVCEGGGGGSSAGVKRKPRKPSGGRMGVVGGG